MNYKLTQTQTFLLAGLAVFAIWAYSKGWFAGPDKGYNLDPTQAPDGSTPSAPPTDPRFKNMATSFRNSMLNNYTSSSIFIEACNNLLKLSDADLISVSNAYNKMYVNEDYNTLRSVLQQEWCFETWSIEKREELLKRFDNINI